MAESKPPPWDDRPRAESSGLARAESARAAAELAAQRFSFLAEAGEALASSLDYEQTLRQVALLALPILGDMCIVDVVADGALHRVATAHVRRESAGLLEQLRQRYPPAPDSPQPAGRVMRSGQPELLATVDSDVIASHSKDAEHAQLIRAIGIRSHLAVPLVARGVIVGVISLGITDSDRQYTEADVQLAEELARRAALAIDNARLYRGAQVELEERRRVEAELSLSNRRVRALVDQSALSMQVLRADGHTVQVNAAWERLWGVTLEQISDYNLLEDPQLEARGIAGHIRRAFAGEAVEIPAIRYDPNQTIPDRSRNPNPTRWVRAFAYPIRDEAGAVREVVLVHEDVSDRMHAQEKLEASEERLRLALLGGRMSVWEWDVESRRVECSGNAREFWGASIEHADDFVAATHPDDRPALAEVTRRAVEEGVPYEAEHRIRRGGGAVGWVQTRARVLRGQLERPSRIIGVTVDITERKTAEQAANLLADLGPLLGASLDPAVTLADLGQLVVPRFADWYVVDLLDERGALSRVAAHHPDPKRLALAMELFRRYPPRRQSRAGAWHVIETGAAEWAESISDEVLRAVAYDAEHLGILRALELGSYISVPLVARGATLGVMSFVLDGQRRFRAADVELAKELASRVAVALDNARLYQRLRDEERRKDDFLATLGHELRNPLAPLRTGLELLDRQSGAPSERTRAMMRRQVGHMVRLIDDLLDLSRITRGTIELRRESLDLSVLVGSALEVSRPLLDEAGLQVAVELPTPPPRVHGDGTRLAQVLSNLLNNAARYTPRGGRVDVSARVDAREVRIEVRDTGIGISRELLDRVFEMFTQVERGGGGLGIGLTIVRRLVELHGGRVWIESEGQGRGSCAVVCLPVEAAAPSPEQARESPALAAGQRRRRLLVVDDNHDAADSLAQLLESFGNEVRVANTGPEALAVVREFTPDLAFLDIGLPGMSGFELAKQLRATPGLGGLTLVAVTGWGQREDREKTREAGFTHHFTKPVEPRQLAAVLAEP